MRGAGDQKQRLSVAFHLRALVRLFRILDRQIVQAELLLEQGEHFVARFVQADPDITAIVFFQRFTDIFDMQVAALAFF